MRYIYLGGAWTLGYMISGTGCFVVEAFVGVGDNLSSFGGGLGIETDLLAREMMPACLHPSWEGGLGYSQLSSKPNLGSVNRAHHQAASELCTGWHPHGCHLFSFIPAGGLRRVIHQTAGRSPIGTPCCANAPVFIFNKSCGHSILQIACVLGFFSQLCSPLCPWAHNHKASSEGEKEALPLLV